MTSKATRGEQRDPKDMLATREEAGKIMGEVLNLYDQDFVRPLKEDQRMLRSRVESVQAGMVVMRDRVQEVALQADNQGNHIVALQERARELEGEVGVEIELLTDAVAKLIQSVAKLETYAEQKDRGFWRRLGETAVMARVGRWGR